MTERDDGDRILDLVGVLLAATILAAVALLVFSAATAPSEAPPDAPSAEWSFDRINTTHVQITHAGGEPVAARSLVVTVGGTDRRVDGWSGMVARGDRGVVRALESEVVRVYWTTDEGERVRLANWRGDG